MRVVHFTHTPGGATGGLAYPVDLCAVYASKGGSFCDRCVDLAHAALEPRQLELPL